MSTRKKFFFVFLFIILDAFLITGFFDFSCVSESQPVNNNKLTKTINIIFFIIHLVTKDYE